MSCLFLFLLLSSLLLPIIRALVNTQTTHCWCQQTQLQNQGRDRYCQYSTNQLLISHNILLATLGSTPNVLHNVSLPRLASIDWNSVHSPLHRNSNGAYHSNSWICLSQILFTCSRRVRCVDTTKRRERSQFTQGESPRTRCKLLPCSCSIEKGQEVLSFWRCHWVRGAGPREILFHLS